MNLQVSQMKEDFQCWLASMSEHLEEFAERFADVDRDRLDFSPSSLDVAEAWILRHYPSTKSMLDSREGQRVNGAACYVGETYRRVAGGTWTIDLDDPDSVFHALPILENNGNIICPLSLVTATADRRTGNFLRTVLENNM